MARAQPGAWRLHRDLVAVSPDLHRHASRRVAALQSTSEGRFRFRRRNHGPDALGRPVFDLYIQYEPTSKEPS